MKNGTLYVLGAFLNAGIPFLFLPILSRILTPEEYGQMNLLVTFYSLIVPVVSIGISGYIYRRFFDNGSISLEIFTRCLRVLLYWVGLILFFTIVGISVYLEFWSNGNDDIVVFLPLLIIAAFCNAIFMCRLQLFLAMNKPIKFLTFQLAYTCSVLVVTISLAVGFGQGFSSRIFGMAVSDIIFSVVAFSLLLKLFRISDVTAEKDEERKFLAFGFGLMPHMVSAVLLSSIDKLVIATYLNMDDLAVYAIAVQFTSILMIFTQGLSKEWSRIFSTDPYSEALLKKGFIFSLSICSVAAVLFLSKELFYNIFVGEHLRYGFDIVNILLFSQIFHCLYMLLAVQIKYDKKTYVLSIFTFISAGVNVALSLYLVTPLGMIGVAYATLAGMLSKFFLVAVYVFSIRFSYRYNKV